MPESTQTIQRLDVPVAGGKLAAFRLGDPGIKRPTVLAVHGITSSSRAWLAVARALGERASLVAVDLRGRGASSALPGPYGLDVHVEDLLAVLEVLGLERAVLAGHSLGAYIVARLGAAHPERIKALVLIDGGLPIPGTEQVDDPQQFLDAFLGPATARLKLRFADRQAYRDWWRAHPALQTSDMSESDLNAYADYDLTGEPPELRSTVLEESVRADGAEVLRPGATTAAHQLAVPARLLVAPRGLLDEPNPMQPLELAWAWAAEDPDRRRAEQVPDVNHYTITLGARGAAAVADAIAAALA
jgi:pimeloyl-ACP methyl ester carboxylesterase